MSSLFKVFFFITLLFMRTWETFLYNDVYVANLIFVDFATHANMAS